MKKNPNNATLLLILGNTLLFLLKIIVGVISNSIAVISDAINSFTDIVASFVVFICVKIGRKKADKEHPFGHHRVDPIAGLIVAIFIAIVGFEIIKVAIQRFITGEQVFFSFVTVAVLVFTMALKTFMALYLRKVSKEVNSPAIFASSVDCRNDVIISSAVLLGFVGYKFGYTYLDPAVGIVIGLWIIFSGYQVGKANIDFLIGKCPNKEFIEKIESVASNIEGVKKLHDVRAHYVGNYVHVELHIEVNKRLSMIKAHSIGKAVQLKLESLPWINKAFIHIDPV